MKTALLFAGQGAQFVGMGRDLAEAFPVAREVFDMTDRILGFPLSRLMFEGPQEELDLTENSQPAVLAMGIACLKVLESQGKMPPVFAAAGLSLGEYGAHVAAGSINVEDAIKLVRKRGELMRDAGLRHPGGMASVLGLSREIVEEVCREASKVGLVMPANYNCPAQVVISGEKAAVELAGELARKRGAKRVVPLRVSGAFHTPLMASARDGLAEALEKTKIRACAFPVVANVTADYVREPADTTRTLLEQLTGAVLFEDSIRRLASDGVGLFLELGPGKVLTGLVKRIAPSAEAMPLGTAEALKSFLTDGGASV